MTYTINSRTSMTLVDAGDMFTTDPILTFSRDGKDVPVYRAIPQILDIDIQDNPIADALDVKVINAIGTISTFTLPDMDAVAAYLVKVAKAPMPTVTIEVTGKPILAAELAVYAAEPSVDAPAPQVTNDTTQATDAAEDGLQAAIAILRENADKDEDELFDIANGRRILFHLAKRIFLCDEPVTVTPADVAEAERLLDASDVAAHMASSENGSAKAKKKAVADADTAQKTVVNACAKFLDESDMELLHDDLPLLTYQPHGFDLFFYRILLQLHKSIQSDTHDTLILARDNEGNLVLNCEDETAFDISSIPGYRMHEVSCMSIATALASGYHVRPATDADDDLLSCLISAASMVIGDISDVFALDDPYCTEFTNMQIMVREDFATVAARATAKDLLLLFFRYNFVDWTEEVFADYLHHMAERLRGANPAPAEATQEATETTPEPTVSDDTATTTDAASEAQEAARTVPVDTAETEAPAEMNMSDFRAYERTLSTDMVHRLNRSVECWGAYDLTLDSLRCARKYAEAAIKKVKRVRKLNDDAERDRAISMAVDAWAKARRGADRLSVILLSPEQKYDLCMRYCRTPGSIPDTYVGINEESLCIEMLACDVFWVANSAITYLEGGEIYAVPTRWEEPTEKHLVTFRAEPPAAEATVTVQADTTSHNQEPAQEPTVAPAVAGTHMYAEICFTGFITDSTGERIEVQDLEAAKAWEAEHPEAVFGDLEVAVWQFTHKDLRGNFVKRCIVVRWAGEDRWFYQLGDNFFRQCWSNMQAMGHTLHPMPKDQRVAPCIASSTDFLDVTDEYFQEKCFQTCRPAAGS